MIKVSASSINPSDIHPNVAPQLLPHAMGSDVAGKVIQVEQGAGTNCRFEVGDLVYGDIGANTFTRDEKKKELGAYAEYAVILDTQVALVPSNVRLLRSCVASKSFAYISTRYSLSMPLRLPLPLHHQSFITI